MKYFYEQYHPRCGRVAFYIKTKPVKGAPVKVSDILLKNGRKPKQPSDVRCGSCGESLRIHGACVRRRLNA